MTDGRAARFEGIGSRNGADSPMPGSVDRRSRSLQLNNVKKKIEKAADKIGIENGETVLAACTTNPKGTMTRMVAKELGGILAAVAADGRQSNTPSGQGLADRFPAGQHYLVLTDRRLLVYSVSAMSGKPKELKAEWSRDELAGIATEPGKLAIPMSIAFADGTAIQIEAARGTNAESLPEALTAAN